MMTRRTGVIGLLTFAVALAAEPATAAMARPGDEAAIADRPKNRTDHRRSGEQGEAPPPVAETVAVPDARSAIHMARRAWMKAHPDLARAISSEADWEKIMKATLKDGVWTVEELLPEGIVGGGVVISLAQADGRVLSMYTLQ